MMSIVSELILIGIIVVVIGLIVFILAKQYRKVGPNEVLIISGGRKRTVIEPDGTKRKIGYRYRLGGGTFVIPFFGTEDIFPMDVIPLGIKTNRKTTRLNSIHTTIPYPSSSLKKKKQTQPTLINQKIKLNTTTQYDTM